MPKYFWRAPSVMVFTSLENSTLSFQVQWWANIYCFLFFFFFSLSILQVIMQEKKASWWIIFKNHDLSSWNDFQRRQTKVQLVMAIVSLYFNFSIRSSVIFVYLPGKVFNCSFLEQSAYTNKFAPCVFAKEWQRPR